MKANKNSLRHKPWLGSVLGKQKEDSWAFRTNILSQSVPLSNRQSPQQTPSARLSTQHRTLEFMERRFRISPHFKLLNLKVCALGVTSFWSRTRDLRWLSLMWSQWWPSVMTIRGRAWLKPQNIQSQTVHLSESLSMVLKLSSTPWNLKQVEKSGHQKRNYSSA